MMWLFHQWWFWIIVFFIVLAICATLSDPQNDYWKEINEKDRYRHFKEKNKLLDEIKKLKEELQIEKNRRGLDY